MVKKQTLFLSQLAILLALEAIVCFTPLGSLPIGPIVATLSHLPVIITAVMLGPAAGAFMGFMFGLFSFLVWTLTPPSPIAFVFTPFYSVGETAGNAWSLVICFVPRILIGVVAGFLFKALSKAMKNNPLAYIISGIAGSLVNTALVLLGIYVFFGQSYSVTVDIAYNVLLGAIGLSILTNGLPEAALGAVAAIACHPVKKALYKQK